MARQTSAGLAGESGSEDEVAFDVHAEKFGIGSGVDATGAVVEGTDERDGGERVSTIVVGGDGLGEVHHPKVRVVLGCTVFAEEVRHGYACRLGAFEPLLEGRGFAALRKLRVLELAPEVVAELLV